MGLAALALAAPLALPAAAETVRGAAWVQDGDTLYIGRERIRLRNAHAPELAEAGGVEARGGLRALVAGEVVTCESRARDRYGRLVAYCRAGSRDLGEAMVAAGLAAKRAPRR